MNKEEPGKGKAMADLSFDGQDIDDLGRKLDQVAAGFDERERLLLVAIITLAREALAARAEAEVTGFGAPSVSNIVVTKDTDSSSPNLFRGCLGSPSQSLTLNFTKLDLTFG